MRPTSVTSVVVAALVVGAVAASPGSSASGDQEREQHTRLLDRRVLPSATVRPDSPPAGAFFTLGDRTNAANNGVVDNDPGPPTSPISRCRASVRWCPRATTRGGR